MYQTIKAMKNKLERKDGKEYIYWKLCKYCFGTEKVDVVHNTQSYNLGV